MHISHRLRRGLRRFAIGAAVLGALGLLGGRYVTSIPWRQQEAAHAPPPPSAEKANAAVATAHPRATDAAREILAEGGNAVDAAIAAALVLAVVEPASSGLGGGGFALVHDPRLPSEASLDFREVAPKGLDAAALLAAARTDASVLRQGARAVAVPGEWNGLVALHAAFGTLPMSRLARAAIAVAREGVEVGIEYTAKCFVRLRALRADPETRRIFLGSFGLCPSSTWVLKQPDLADTLAALTDDSHPATFADRVGAPMVRHVAELGGPFSADDAAGPAPKPRRPIYGSFHGYRVVSMGPPSSGGLIVVSWLQTYERARARLPAAPWEHLWIESSRLAFFDRAERMGDPDFVEVPAEQIASPVYADAQAARIDASTSLKLEAPAPKADGPHTTHLSVVDSTGMAAALTLSINLPFGSGLTVPGTGILLNDEMDDFASDAANAFRLVGNEKNAPLAGKRPLSSMAPTMLFDERGALYLVIGSPGGSAIPSAVASVVRNLVEDHMEPGAAMHAPRIHHQWMPDHVEVERPYDGKLPDDVKAGAQKSRLPMGNVQMVVRTDSGWRGVSDCRGYGEAWSGVVGKGPVR